MAAVNAPLFGSGNGYRISFGIHCDNADRAHLTAAAVAFA